VYDPFTKATLLNNVFESAFTTDNKLICTSKYPTLDCHLSLIKFTIVSVLEQLAIKKSSKTLTPDGFPYTPLKFLVRPLPLHFHYFYNFYSLVTMFQLVGKFYMFYFCLKNAHDQMPVITVQYPTLVVCVELWNALFIKISNPICPKIISSHLRNTDFKRVDLPVRIYLNMLLIRF